jgi:hypothetical protein
MFLQQSARLNCPRQSHKYTGSNRGLAARPQGEDHLGPCGQAVGIDSAVVAFL